NGGSSLGTATTNSSGVAALSNVSLGSIAAGTYGTGVAASFGGDSSFSASSGTASLTVNKADQTIIFVTLPDKTFGDPAFTVSATGGASGNAVTFTASGQCSSGGTNGATITITAAGSCTVTAHQAGNSDYNAATDVPQSFAVSKAAQTVA